MSAKPTRREALASPSPWFWLVAVCVGAAGRVGAGDVKTVNPDQVSVLDQTPDPTATPITCVPTASTRTDWVVTARLA